MKKTRQLDGVCGTNSKAKTHSVLFGIAVLLLAALFTFTGCPTDPDDDGNPDNSTTDTRVELTAGAAVSAAAADTSKAVTFTGATGLTLTIADFAVTTGGTISNVAVASGTATVTVAFAANLSTTAKTYTVSIASTSTKIKGTATVAINQAASETDQRVTLTAGPAVPVAATATTADVTFTGATGLTLTIADFAVTTGGTISNPRVSGGTATVTVTFAANTETTAKTYTVSIPDTSSTIKGTTTVAITQAASTGTDPGTDDPGTDGPGTDDPDPTPGASGTTINLTFWPNESDNTITVDKNSITITSAQSLTANVTGDYTSVQWYVDGAAVTGATGNSITISGATYNLWIHRLGVTVIKGGVPYSKEITFTVTE